MAAAAGLLGGCTGGAAPSGVHATATVGPPSAVSEACYNDGAIGFTSSPISGVVEGRVSIATRMAQPAVSVQGQGRWRYWQKWGLAVLDGALPVEITVPADWRTRLAITWGNHPVGSSLRLNSCPEPAGEWDVYAGGFYLTSARACVPLTFAIGEKHATVWFGVGRQCG